MYTANPRRIPSARMLRSLGYDEAQELASAGAKVLHPRCLGPVRQRHIPLHIRCTSHPDHEGTVVSDTPPSSAAQVKAIATRTGITLVSMDTPGMWQQVGFLADVFACFKSRGLSVDLVSTSEMNVTVSLDEASNALDQNTLLGLLGDLESLCHARVIGPCSAVSLVGQHIRAILHRLGPVLEVFEEQRIHLLSQAANDLNLTFVVDTDQADRLVQQLHELLFPVGAPSAAFGPTWNESFGVPAVAPAPAWWSDRSSELIELARGQSPLYVYDEATLAARTRQLRSLRSVDRVLYAVKANPFPPILRLLQELGLGFECVSPGEIRHLQEHVPGLDPASILFTPNFAPRTDYEFALARGVMLTLDNLHPLRSWPELFRSRDLFVRLDPGQPRGHHDYVRTAGSQSKFGIPAACIDELRELLDRAGARVIGLHAHRGSGIRAHEEWARTGAFLSSVLELFPHAKVLDLGGGLGVPERPAHTPLDLEALDASLQALRSTLPDLRLWLEPGRFPPLVRVLAYPLSDAALAYPRLPGQQDHPLRAQRRHRDLIAHRPQLRLLVVAPHEPRGPERDHPSERSVRRRDLEDGPRPGRRRWSHRSIRDVRTRRELPRGPFTCRAVLRQHAAGVTCKRISVPRPLR